LQIAAHTDAVPLDELYRICAELREELTGAKDGVGRIIARPFEGSIGAFRRTADRHDYSLRPPARLLPEAVKDGGLESVSVGKINDIFADVGFSEVNRTHSNKEGMEIAERYIKSEFCGLCFVNLVDFDMLWGHRRDALGYAEGLNDFDAWLGRVLPELCEGDLLMITADHGCDPSFTVSTDHTREYTPFIAYSKDIVAENFGTRECFADIASTVAALLDVELTCDGEAINIKFSK
jgi:phosphopentomutase